MSTPAQPDPEQRKVVQVQLRVERMYVKDASLESPGTPNIFAEQFRPEMKVDINSRVNSLGDNRHEVVLSATVTATRDEQRTAYLVEVHQAGIFVIEGVQGDPLGQVLGVACPNMLFPYLREALDSLIVKAGFPPIQLAPVNFDALYAQAMAQQNQQRSGQQTGQNPDADKGDEPIKH